MILKCLATLALCVLAALPAAAQENVVFQSLDTTLAPPLTAAFYKPAGAGPFPAMVLLHPCNGVSAFETGWAQWFVQQGYAALIVDSFGPRGVRTVCGVGGRPTLRDRALDAFGALAFLRLQSGIDPKRIGAIGWSHGGGVALVADNKQLVTATMQGNGFTAVVGLYPVCANNPVTALAAPMAFLLGSADDWTPAPICEGVATSLQAGGSTVSVHTYPGVTHAFDNPRSHGIVHVAGHQYNLIYDDAAAKDARVRVHDFLAEQLK